MKEIKIKVYDKIKQLLKEQIETAQKEINRTKEARDNETKSSVGDKYETGRAMMQIELGKLENQLAKTNGLLQTLLSIDVEKTNDRIALGSIVQVDTFNYFISVGIGKIVIEKKMYFAISPASPIGQLLLGKKQGDSFQFQGKTKEIKAIY